MEPVLEALDAQQRELRCLVENLDRDGLERPSACLSWRVADVLLHLAQTNELVVASLAGELESFAARQAAVLEPGGNVDDYAGALVEQQRIIPSALGQGGITAAGPVAFELTAPDEPMWEFGTDDAPLTVVRGPAVELCTVPGKRSQAADTSLTTEGPDGAEVLARMRTFA